MGRPKGSVKCADHVRSVSKPVRWTPSEWAAVEREALAVGETVSEFIRAAALCRVAHSGDTVDASGWHQGLLPLR